MTGFVDLHCHWLPEIDDGARTISEGVAMLRALGSLGFSHVVATPHMRPGLFDNQRSDLVQRFTEVIPLLREEGPLPDVSLASEHHFDERVLSDVRSGRGLPYRAQCDPSDPRSDGAILVEFLDLPPPQLVERQLFELQTLGYIPVIAHPERYRVLWRDPSRLERLVELGSVALLDTAALVGKYGSEPQRCAQTLLEMGLYDAACSDAHRPTDVEEVASGMAWLRREYGEEEVQFLFSTGPRALLSGLRPQ